MVTVAFQAHLASQQMEAIQVQIMDGKNLVVMVVLAAVIVVKEMLAHLPVLELQELPTVKMLLLLPGKGKRQENLKKKAGSYILAVAAVEAVP